MRKAKEDDEAHEISTRKKGRKSSKKRKQGGSKDRSESRLERRREDIY